MLGLDRRGDAGDQPAAAGGHHDAADFGQLRQDLPPHGSLTSDDVGMVVGVDELRSGLPGVVPRRDERCLQLRAVQPDVCAVCLGGRDLRQRNALGHEHRGVDAQQRRGERDPLPVVPGARCDHTGGALRFVQPQQPHVGAAELERAGALEVFALEKDFAAAVLTEHPRVLDGGAPCDPGETFTGDPDSVQIDQPHVPIVPPRIAGYSGRTFGTLLGAAGYPQPDGTARNARRVSPAERG